MRSCLGVSGDTVPNPRAFCKGKSKVEIWWEGLISKFDEMCRLAGQYQTEGEYESAVVGVEERSNGDATIVECGCISVN